MSEVVKKLFVQDLKIKEDVKEIFFLKHIALMEGRDGRSYLNLVLSDVTGDLEGRMWQKAQNAFEMVERGQLCCVQGKVNIYQGRKQLVVSEIYSIQSKDHNLDENDFYPRSNEKPEIMYQQLSDIVEELDDVYIKDLLRAVLFDSEIKSRLLTWAAGKTVHHAYKGGLLEHILSCSKLAVSLSAHYEVNKNYVVAGAILHDLCKIYELTEGPNVEYTDEGKLIGHLVKAVELIDHFSSKIRNFPHNLKVHLKHIILSHHGQYEYGSPKLPQTSEANLVHLIDYIDSKMNAFEMIKTWDNNPGNWSSYVKHMDRIIYRPKLPHYTEYVVPKNKESDQQNIESTKTPHKKRYDDGSGPLKQSMSGLLEGFKINNNS